MIELDQLILLDTNILVHLLRGKAAGQWLDTTYLLSTRHVRPLLSVVSLGELLALAEKWSWKTEKQQQIHALVQSYVVVDINHRPVLDSYARLSSRWERAGKRMEQNDLWIAASAEAAGAAILTTDRDFGKLSESIAVEWVDPEKLKKLLAT